MVSTGRDMARRVAKKEETRMRRIWWNRRTCSFGRADKWGEPAGRIMRVIASDGTGVKRGGM